MFRECMYSSNKSFFTLSSLLNVSVKMRSFRNHVTFTDTMPHVSYDFFSFSDRKNIQDTFSFVTNGIQKCINLVFLWLLAQTLHNSIMLKVLHPFGPFTHENQSGLRDYSSLVLHKLINSFQNIFHQKQKKKLICLYVL